MSLISLRRRTVARSLSVPRVYLWAIAIIAAFMPYLQVLRLPFASDDYALMYQLTRLGPFGIWSGPQTAGAQFIRPLVSLSLYLNYLVGGINPLGYHLFNLGFHFMNALLVGVVTCKVVKKVEVAGIAGFLFAVWPHHTDAVTWVSGRTDVLAAFFVLLCLWSYLSFVEDKKRGCLWASYLLFVIALLCKESALVVPLLIMILDRGLGGGREKTLVPSMRPVIPFWILLGGYFGMRYAVFGSAIGGYGTSSHLNCNLRMILTQVGVQAYRLFIPMAASTRLEIYLAVAIVPGILVVGDLLCRHNAASLRSYRAFCLAAFASLLPVITMEAATFDPGIGGERFAYLASCFGVVALSLILVQLQKKGGKMGRSSLFLVCCASICSLFHQNELWTDAAEEARADLKALGPYVQRDQPVLVAAVVDNLRGVYVWHTGLGQAEYLASARFRGPLLSVYQIVGYEPGDQVTARRQGDILTLQVVPSPTRQSEQRLGLYRSPSAPERIRLQPGGTVSRISFRIPATLLGETSHRPMKPRVLLLFGGHVQEIR